MLTILNRRFPTEISLLIMQNIVLQKVRNTVIPQMYISNHRMQKFINMYKLDEDMLYDMKLNFAEIKEIYSIINNIQSRFIDFDYYKHNDFDDKIIKKFNYTINSVNEKCKDQVVYPLIKKMIIIYF
jgi:hypothetical protein